MPPPGAKERSLGGAVMSSIRYSTFLTGVFLFWATLPAAAQDDVIAYCLCEPVAVVTIGAAQRDHDSKAGGEF